MKTALLFPVLLVSLLLTQARADWVIVQKTSSLGQEQEVTMKMKGDKARSDVGEEMSVIIDGESGAMQMLMHQQKMVMSMDANAMEGVMKMAEGLLKQAGGDDGGDSSLKATGETEKIGEWDCEIYTWKGDTGKFWISKDFSGYEELNKFSEKLSSSMGMKGGDLMPKAEDIPGMVIKSEVTMMGQKSTTVLISAEEKDLDAADFEVPEGYQAMSMPNIPGLNGGN